MNIVDGDDPWLASNVESDTIDTGIVLSLIDESGLNEVREFGDGAHGSLNVTGTGTTLLHISVVDAFVGIK